MNKEKREEKEEGKWENGPYGRENNYMPAGIVRKEKVMKKKTGGKGALASKGALAFFAALLLLGMVTVLAGCGGGSALAGKWQEVEDGEPSGEIMEFLKDGTLDYGGIKGEWKAEKGRLTFSIWGSSETVDYKISGSTLTLIDDGGDEEIYQKVKK